MKLAPRTLSARQDKPLVLFNSKIFQDCTMLHLVKWTFAAVTEGIAFNFHEQFVLRRHHLTVTHFDIMQIQQHVNIDIFIVYLMVHYYCAFNNYDRATSIRIFDF